MKRNLRLINNPSFWIIIFTYGVLMSLYYADTGVFTFNNPRWEWLWNLTIFEFKNNIHGSLFIILFVYAAAVFGWRGLLITWVFSMALIMPRIYYMTPDTTSLVANIVFLLIPLLAVLVWNLQRIWRDAVREAAAQREEEHQAYIAQIIKAQESERKRISREIHDDTTQRLWILANSMRNLIPKQLREIAPQTASKLEAIQGEILQISGDAKRLSLALRPGILDDLGLVPAIRWQIDQLNNNGSAAQAKIIVEGTERQLSHDSSTHLFRIAQEAVNNAKRHSEATNVVVTLAFDASMVKMSIRDNGKGFSVSNINKLPKENKLGIIGIQERARLLGGDLKIRSRRDKGTTISVEFCDRPAQRQDEPLETLPV
jgi:signal transduction histidine kinase